MKKKWLKEVSMSLQLMLKEIKLQEVEEAVIEAEEEAEVEIDLRLLEMVIDKM
jgi:hypothetical protein